MKPAVILVGADKGGVGKTTVARALLDFLNEKNLPTRAFDTEAPRGNLKRFHPEITDVVNILHTPDQMRILDTLQASQQRLTLIDVRAGHMRVTLKALQDIGFLDAVDQGHFNFVVLHVLGPSVASLNELDEIAPFVRGAEYFVVKNIIQEAMFFEWDPETYSSYFSKVRRRGDIIIPPLNEMANEQVDLANTPFSRFVSNLDGTADFSFVLRGYVRTWMKKVSLQFENAELLKALGVSSAGSMVA